MTKKVMDLFGDTAAILNPVVSNSFYGMLRRQIHTNLPPEHPTIAIEIAEFQMAAVSPKRQQNNILTTKCK